MFDFAWSEIALIGVVALIAIGPKDLPVAMKTVAAMVKKARRMAGEFQTHVDEMVREANLDEVRSQINEIRNFDIKGEIEKAVDADGSIRSTFASNPLEPGWTLPATDAPAGDTAVAELPAHTITALEGADSAQPAEAAARPEPPAFIPPEIANRPEPPAFIPPGVDYPGALRS
ncbi:Sec-independent protein translocase protein TatB [Limobrevibacterium gyesilva]|uniref:Sec-independent protein translocase protein TatB n=1 Tax=Limobrevibacterium gyesilva TaxID=2991712 RepID=A0AA41YN27_9PROT|nr:Sec-independent protein translocase protein TatB [Limobrevibacterium gyesilva]MCW3475740.1 Sec-independent protein translocase protein TatB [Limobrevibacterium gyesilva]